MARQLILDTETTGLKPENGDRIVEIAAWELIDGKETGNYYHVYINPQKKMPEEAFTVHGLSDEFLKDKPLFKTIVNDFLDYIKDAELLIHKADFDIKFLNAELEKADKPKIWQYVKEVTCTLTLDKMLYAKERSHTLDNICKRFNIDLSERENNGHGALLDCQLLTKAYLKMCEEHPRESMNADLEQRNWVRPPIKRMPRKNLVVSQLNEIDILAHNAQIEEMQKLKVTPLFGILQPVRSMRP